MSGINWSLLQPVDTGSLVQQGFGTGMALVKGIQTRSALGAYLANPDDPQAYGALAYLDLQTAQSMQQQRAAQIKARQEAEALEAQRIVGAQAASGDIAGARTAALQGGQFDLAKQIGELDDEQRKRTAEFWEKAGPVAWQLKQERDPARRAALWQEAKPILAATAGNPALLDQLDPTNDAQLDMAIATSQKVGDLITQSRVTWHQQGEQPSFATDYFGRPVGSQNPYRQGGAPAPAAQSAVASTLSSAMPAHVVAGFLGNFDVEGGWGGAVGDAGKAKGIAQWHPDRLANYERAIGKPFDPADHEGQARFVLWEMQNPEAAGMTVAQRDAILNAPDAATAAALIDQHYERSDGKHRQKRIKAAQRFAAGASDPATIKAQAQAAIAAGADPEKVRARAKSMGVDL